MVHSVYEVTGLAGQFSQIVSTKGDRQGRIISLERLFRFNNQIGSSSILK